MPGRRGKARMGGCILASVCLFTLAAVDSAVATEPEPTVMIVAEPKSGPGPLKVRLQAYVSGLRSPLRFHWSLGDGTEWDGAEPPALTYRVGRYNVILSVTDADGRVKTASITIEAVPRG